MELKLPNIPRLMYFSYQGEISTLLYVMLHNVSEDKTGLKN